MTTVAITGSTGYVGAAIAARAQEDGHAVVALSRRPTVGFPYRHYDLDELPSRDLLSGVDVVVHCAYDLSLTRARDISRVNVEGTRRIAASAAAAGSKFVLISSMSAYPGTRQIYGRAKLAAERSALDAGGEAVRLGLVYGGDDDDGGMIGALQRLVALPITPVIGRHAHQFTIHVNDMVRGVLRLALGTDRVREPVGLAHPVPVKFEDLLVALVCQTGTRLRPLYVPWQAAYLAMRTAEALRLPLPLRADSIIGLVRPASVVPRAGLWAQLGVPVRAFEEWIR